MVAAVALAFTLFNFMKRSADDSRKKQDNILKEFKRIDESLQKTSDSVNAANGRLFQSMKEKTTN